MNSSDYPSSPHDESARSAHERQISEQELVNLRHRVSSEVNRLDAEINNVRGRPMVLLGILSTLVLLLIGVSGWLIMRMQRLETADRQPLDPDLGARVEAVELKLEALDQEISEDISRELEETQQQLSQIETDLQSLQSALTSSETAIPSRQIAPPAATQPQVEQQPATGSQQSETESSQTTQDTEDAN